MRATLLLCTQILLHLNFATLLFLKDSYNLDPILMITIMVTASKTQAHYNLPMKMRQQMLSGYPQKSEQPTHGCYQEHGNRVIHHSNWYMFTTYFKCLCLLVEIRRVPLLFCAIFLPCYLSDQTLHRKFLLSINTFYNCKL